MSFTWLSQTKIRFTKHVNVVPLSNLIKIHSVVSKRRHESRQRGRHDLPIILCMLWKKHIKPRLHFTTRSENPTCWEMVSISLQPDDEQRCHPLHAVPPSGSQATVRCGLGTAGQLRHWILDPEAVGVNCTLLSGCRRSSHKGHIFWQLFFSAAHCINITFHSEEKG